MKRASLATTEYFQTAPLIWSEPAALKGLTNLHASSKVSLYSFANLGSGMVPSLSIVSVLRFSSPALVANLALILLVHSSSISSVELNSLSVNTTPAASFCTRRLGFILENFLAPEMLLVKLSVCEHYACCVFLH